MRNRMLIVIALMLIVSAAIAQEGEGSGTEVPLGQPAAGAQTGSDQAIRELTIEAATAGKNAADAQAALDVATAKLGVAGNQIAAERVNNAALQAALDAKNKQRLALRRLNTAQAARAIATGRKAHWDEAKASAALLDKLDGKIASLEAEFRQMQEYLHNGGYFAELHAAGFVTRGETDQLYAPKSTPAIAPASPAPLAPPVTSPATSGKMYSETPAQTPAKEKSKMDPWAVVAIVGIVVGAIVALVIFTPRRPSVVLTAMNHALLGRGVNGMTTTQVTQNGIATVASTTPPPP